MFCGEPTHVANKTTANKKMTTQNEDKNKHDKTFKSLQEWWFLAQEQVSSQFCVVTLEHVIVDQYIWGERGDNYRCRVMRGITREVDGSRVRMGRTCSNFIQRTVHQNDDDDDNDYGSRFAFMMAVPNMEQPLPHICICSSQRNINRNEKKYAHSIRPRIVQTKETAQQKRVCCACHSCTCDQQFAVLLKFNELNFNKYWIDIILTPRNHLHFTCTRLYNYISSLNIIMNMSNERWTFFLHHFCARKMTLSGWSS